MQINLSGHHVDVTPSLKKHVTDKLQRIRRHFDHVTSADVILTVEKPLHKAEATVHLSGAKIYAHASHTDMYASIDILVDKLVRQVQKHKEKITDHHRNDGGLKARTDQSTDS